ncbi:MAG: NAD(P)/FAD-dependent oxidoreductase [Candidatus Binataceae bacterium]
MAEAGSGPHVIVVGAGVVGCSLAFHLAQLGAEVTVFDKGEICAGMSAWSGALVRMHYSFAPEAALAWKSLEYFENWARMVGGRCGFVRTGFAIVVARKNAEKLRANVAMLKSLGVETELVDRDQLHKIEPAARVDDVAIAAYEPRSGYADPVATTQAFAAAANKLGVTFALNMPIAALAINAGRAAGVTDSSGKTHAADFVCIAAGPWTDTLLAPFGVKIGIKPERAQIAFFRKPPTVRHSIFIDTIAGSYFRPHGDDLTMAGLGALNPRTPTDPDSFKETNDTEFIEAVRARVSQRIPVLKDAAYVRGHAGIYDVTPDARAALGPIAAIPGLYVAAGFSGTGFKTSPAVGAAMAELIVLGKSKTADLSAFSYERFVTGEIIHAPNEYAMAAGFGHTL